MKSARVILPFYFILILVFPWTIVEICIAHPLGQHKSHAHEDGLSPCELRKLYGGKGVAFFPPMECHNLNVSVDECFAPEKRQAITPFKTFHNTAAFPETSEDILRIEYFITSPDFKYSSGPPIPINTFRGPPLS